VAGVSDAGRWRGALLGLAAGDALGTTLELRKPGTLAPLADLTGGGPFGLAPGQRSDDTCMALCLAGSPPAWSSCQQGVRPRMSLHSAPEVRV
jgi:ADP-ribosylglycohydrolase